MKRATQGTKRGAASLFVVIITIILLGVVTLGFTRLILSEASQISNSDLSQSAYDSALAGVEDAKIALLKYHDCLSKGATKSSGTMECQAIVRAMQNGIQAQSCDTVSNVLGREQGEGEGPNTGEVIVQETQNSEEAGNAEYMAQAYTCVTIQEELGDYRTTLDGVNRLRIIPLRTDRINDIKTVNIQWYSDANATATSSSEWPFEGGKLPQRRANTTDVSAPLLSVQLIQADKNFNLSELSAAYSEGRTDIGVMYLAPAKDNGGTTISASEVSASGNKAQENSPKQIKCKDNPDPFYCGVDIELPRPFGNGNRNEGAAFLIVGIPYGAPATDVSITLKLENDDVVKFTGVQARIDSTGRANDLFRRVESRVELVDTNFPYPEFAIQLIGDENSVLEKNFWVTNNCWTANNGTANACPEGNNNAGS